MVLILTSRSQLYGNTESIILQIGIDIITNRNISAKTHALCRCRLHSRAFSLVDDDKIKGAFTAEQGRAQIVWVGPTCIFSVKDFLCIKRMHASHANENHS